MTSKNINKNKTKFKAEPSLSSAPNKKTGSFWDSIEKKEWWIVSAIAVLAFTLRIIGAGRFSFWFDEYLHVIPASEFLQGRGMQHIDGLNGVFTTWVEVLFMGIFGKTEWAARFAMVFFSTATVFPLYFLAKKLFNSKVAIVTILLFSISLYNIYWGKVVRNYATFLPFYLFFHIALLSIFEKNENSNSFSIVDKFNINIKTVVFLLGSFLLAILNHQLTVFAIFAWVFYGSIRWVLLAKESKGKDIFNRYTIFIPSLLAFFSLFTKAGGGFAKSILGILLPPNIVNFVIPNTERLSELWKTKPFESFNVYWDAINTDSSYLYLFALIGILAGFYTFKKSTLYLVSNFVIILLLFSFVFREPAVVRYLYFIYPFFFMLVAFGAWSLLSFISQKVLVKTKIAESLTSFLLLFFVLFLMLQPKNISAFLKQKEHGQIVDKSISEWVFTNWQEPLKYVKENRQQGDVVLSTVPNSARFYLDLDTSELGWFRQNILNAIEKKYQPNEPSGKPVSGYTTEEFIKTVETYPRGWLVADYYFYNVMTDPKARQYATENLQYHYMASTDGSVQVFSWDHNKPQRKSPLFVELGKPLGGQASPPIDFSLSLSGPETDMVFYLEIEGVDSDAEAFMVLNGSAQVAIPKPQGKGYGKEMAKVRVNKAMLKEGANQVQFSYNPAARELDYRPGFVIYNLTIGN
jgi:hypothetical protein